MKKCRVCGKEIPHGLTYCSSECAEKDKVNLKVISESEKPFASQFDRGHGSVRREANIKKVAEMLKEGVPEEDIRFQLSMLFRPMTVDDYLRVAKEWLKRESQNEPS